MSRSYYTSVNLEVQISSAVEMEFKSVLSYKIEEVLNKGVQL